MAGTLIISDELCWMAQNWIHDNVLESMAEVLKSEEPGLAATLLDSRTFQNGGYLDLRLCDKETLAKFGHAAVIAEKQFRNEGASSFCSPEAYPGFMKYMRELKEMLRAASVPAE